MTFFAFSGLIKKFAHLSQFNSIKDFNNNVEKWLCDHKSHFTKSELIALKRLVRFSAKHYGVSNAKVQTLVSATHKQKDQGGISRSTFERMLRKAKQIGLLVVNGTTKANGKGKGHNVYVFKRYFLSTIDVLKNRILMHKQEAQNKHHKREESINLPSETNSLLETNNTKNNNIYMDWLEDGFVDPVKIEYQERRRAEREEAAKMEAPSLSWMRK
ncbi:hypothetical protein BTR22_05220 [Alkalihalophilus pseudofirmus]|uniref:hypothetical protein n=1 Tax=Alkalihalophilus pseudofirmus TaxID=79885 RepID=UPI0009525255|nr:hypothetical protein BTR22_05220 [Alkalihalophilus pseudofirmus]